MLDEESKKKLEEAIKDYDFPAVYFDFENEREIIANNMLEVENYIKSKLTSNSIQEVKDGLSNVLYWGHAKTGYRSTRVYNFRTKVLNKQIEDFQEIAKNNIDLIKIEKLKMPEYSKVSFISKVMMFLCPEKFCVLDKQLAKISICTKVGALGELKYGGETYIGVTQQNQKAYLNWCNECKLISEKCFGNKYRTVDIERGFFNLIQKGNCSLAKAIYETAVKAIKGDNNEKVY